MTQLRILLILIAIVLASSAEAKAKRYDERGNLISAEASSTPVAAPTNRPEISESVPPEQVTPPSLSESPKEAEPNAAAPAPGSDATTAPEAIDEEAEARRQQKYPLTKVYFENAEMYLRSNRTDKALENLKKSQESGEDEFSRLARLKSLWLRARAGEANLDAEAEGLDDKLKVQGLLSIADGYQVCARELLKKPECLREAERMFAFVSELQPGSTEGRLARLRLGLLLLENGRLEAALPHLTRALLNETASLKQGEVAGLPLDRAYYMLGQLYERPWYHKDAHKAQVAYRQVLKFAGSPYQSVARERLAYLERFATGYARP